MRVAEGYLVDRWTVADGMPVSDATGVRFARSGYLWLTTFDGLVRFDGQRIEVFNASKDPELASNRLVGLVETPDGQLWLSTEHYALVRFDGVRFHPLGRRQGLPDETVLARRLDAAGRLWVGTQRGLAVRAPTEDERAGSRRTGGRFHPWAAGAISGAVRAILPLPGGRLWVGTVDDGLYLLDDERVRRHLRRREGSPFDGITALEIDGRGGIWVGSVHGIARLAGGTVERLAALDGHPINSIHAIPGGGVLIVTIWRNYTWRAGQLHLRSDRPTARNTEPLRVDPSGAVWTVDQEVLARDGREVLAAPCAITGFDFDPVGAVWLATACDGLWRVRERRVVAITPAQGLPDGPVYSLAQTPDGTLWATTGGGTVSEIRDDRVVAVHDVSIPGQTLRTLVALADGSLWLGHDGVCRLVAGSCESPPDQPEILAGSIVRALHVGVDGNLWVGSESGLWRRDATGWRVADEELLLAPRVVVRDIHLAASGNLWFATTRDGLRRLTPAGEVSLYAVGEGLASASIRDLHEDERGHLWVATENRGVCRSVVPELAGIPLIFLTARATDRDEIAGLAIGADQYLKKPFHREVLEAHVAAAIRACERLRDRFAQEAPRALRRTETLPAGERSASLPERVRAWIEANAHEESLSIDDLAAALYMSRRSLERSLQAATGKSPAEYIRTVRLSRARRLLRESAGSVSEVAYAVGFNSLAAFSRAYRAAFGEPPSRERVPTG